MIHKSILPIIGLFLSANMLVALNTGDQIADPHGSEYQKFGQLSPDSLKAILVANGGGWVIYAYTSDDGGVIGHNLEFYPAFEGQKIGGEFGDPAGEVFWFTNDSVYFALPRAGKLYASSWRIEQDMIITYPAPDAGPILDIPRKIEYADFKFSGRTEVEKHLTVNTIKISGINGEGETQWWYLAPISLANAQIRGLEFGEVLPGPVIEDDDGIDDEADDE